MSRGLLGLVEGFSEGYVTGSKLRAQREQAENDKKRLGFEETRMGYEKDRIDLERARADREKTDSELRNRLTQQQIDAGALDLDARKRDQEYQKNQSKRLSDLVLQSRGGVQLDVIDPSGKSVGPMIFGSMEDATRDLQTKGLTFKPGSAKQLPPLNQVDLEMRAADIMLEEALRYGKVTPELLKEAKNRRKEAEREGAIEALRYFHTTGDQDGAKKLFNKNGKIKIGDDVQLELKPGMFGPTVTGYRIGKDGTKQEVFDGFRDVILPSMSAEAYANTITNFKLTQAKEDGDTKRTQMNNDTAVKTTGMSNETAVKTTGMNNETSVKTTGMNNQTTLTTTSMNNKGAMDRELVQARVRKQAEKDPVYGQLEDLIMGQGKAAISNPSNAMNIEKYTQDNLDILNYAYALMKDGKAKSVPDAAAKATAAVRAARNQSAK